MRPSRTTTVASRTGGPPLPSISVPLVMIVVPVASFMGESVYIRAATARERETAPAPSRSRLAKKLSQRTQERMQQPLCGGRILPVHEMTHAAEVYARAIVKCGGQCFCILRRKHSAFFWIADDEQRGTFDVFCGGEHIEAVEPALFDCGVHRGRVEVVQAARHESQRRGVA